MDFNVQQDQLNGVNYKIQQDPLCGMDFNVQQDQLNGGNYKIQQVELGGI